MNDKEKIYLQACLYAITKLIGKGSCRYSWENDDGKWNSISLDEVMDWILEKRGVENETIPLDKIRAEILDEAEYAYADFDKYKEDVLHAEFDELPDDDFRYGLQRAIEIIDKYKAGEKE